MRPPRSPDLEVELTLLPTLLRGRTSGWRPNNDFGLEHFNDAHIEFVGCEGIEPGQTARAEMWLLWPEAQTGRLSPGFKFTVHEGRPLIANGVVISVLRGDLSTHA
jgi:hypothetical protein